MKSVGWQAYSTEIMSSKDSYGDRSVRILRVCEISGPIEGCGTDEACPYEDSVRRATLAPEKDPEKPWLARRVLRKCDKSRLDALNGNWPAMQTADRLGIFYG